MAIPMKKKSGEKHLKYVSSGLLLEVSYIIIGVGKKVATLPSCFGLNPAGLQYSTDNQFVQRLKELQDSAAMEKIPLIPSTPEEMSEMLQLCSYVRFKVPQQVPCSSSKMPVLCQRLGQPAGALSSAGGPSLSSSSM